MTDRELIIEIDKKVKQIYSDNDLIPLRGKGNSYKIHGKDILMWFGEVTRHCSCMFKENIDHNKLIEDLLLTSDEIVYFTAHIYLYRPYINNPIRDSYTVGDRVIYPMFTNLEGRRYEMFSGVLFEKMYNYWDRIGDLIASFYPKLFPRDKYFPVVIRKLKENFTDNPDFNWLYRFLQNEYKVFNKERILVVHEISNSTERNWRQLSHITDYEKTKSLHEEKLKYPEFFKNMNELCKTGFVKTLNLLEEINKRENYRCPE